MTDLYSRFVELCNDFENSDIVKDYTAAKKELFANKEALSKVKEFKKLHIQFCDMEKEGRRDLGFEKHVSSVYFSLLRDDDTAAFIRAENRLLKNLKFVASSIDELLNRNGIKGFGSEEL